ncbi:EAL domain-containing protein [Exiguobacterium sp. s193]|uniref:putative bifunctional diguanylate cyclase/phosphodiesterase n=1 Tax=Exiguobacterium sp. s193 TaxID=2751207 RepID=UPI001BE7BDF9|nr:EAL domain-containing protein [Exiguobacterium sp. s193]
MKVKQSHYFYGIFLFCLSYYIWIWFYADRPEMSSWGNNIFSVVGCAVATFLLLRTYRTIGQEQGRFFLYLSYGTGSYFIAELIWMFYENFEQVEVPFPGPPDIFYMLQSFFFFVAFLHLIRKYVTKHHLVRFIFDILIVMTVAVTYSWFFLVRPALVGGVTSGAENFLAFAYPMNDVVLLFCIISIYFLVEQRKETERPTCFSFLFIGLLIQITADTIFLYMTTTRGYETVDWIDPLFILSLLLVAVSGHAGEITVERIRVDQGRVQSLQLGRLFLPYLLVILLFSTMLFYAQRGDALNGLMIGCGVTILLILIRQILMILSNHELIQEIHHKADELEESKERYESLFTYHPDAVYSLDLKGQIESANPSFEKLAEHCESELVGRSYSQLLRRTDATESGKNEMTASQFETIFEKDNGGNVLLNVTSIPIRVKQQVVGMFGIGQDITSIRENELKIRQLAYYDHLTGAVNRKYFEEILHQLVEKEQNQETIILCFIDLDDFKLVNDSYGHQIGDQLLIEVAERLRYATEVDDVVARQGGDEFTVILRHVTSEETARTRTDRLLTRLNAPYTLEGIELISSPSIGAVKHQRVERKAVVTLLKQADLAMYQAKAKGGKRIVFFDDIAEAASYRLRLESELPLAIETDQLVLYYQPQVDTVTYQMVGVEGLIRWNHPELGMISPNDFIPLAEEAGMIIRLGEWVLREGFLQAKRWEDKGIELKVGLNVSMQQFHHPTFVLTLVRLVKETQVNPKQIDLEITEVSATEDIEETVETMHRLKQLGFTISIDDFGTGYSSLSRLVDFPIDTLKIPREFVQKINVETSGYSMISSIIHLAQSLNLAVIAEGVETLEQVNVLNQLVCERMQGYYFGRPMPPREIEPLLYRDLT